MNRIMLCGRLTRDAKFQNGEQKDRAWYTIAVNRGFAKDAKADFIPVTSFGNKDNGFQKFVETYLTKGRQVIIEGRLQINYNPETKKQFVNVISDKIQLLAAPKAQAEPSPEDEPVVEEEEVQAEEEVEIVEPVKPAAKAAPKPAKAAASRAAYVNF